MTSEQVRRLAFSLTGCHEAPHFDKASFRVDNKIFATMSESEGVLHVFVNDTERDAALALYGEFVEPLRWGKTVRGLRIILAKAKAAVVADLLAKSWRSRAS